jgi:hypothetical protein
MPSDVRKAVERLVRLRMMEPIAPPPAPPPPPRRCSGPRLADPLEPGNPGAGLG